jgi:hypothetical protein
MTMGKIKKNTSAVNGTIKIISLSPVTHKQPDPDPLFLELNDPTDGKVLKHTYTWCIFWE